MNMQVLSSPVNEWCDRLLLYLNGVLITLLQVDTIIVEITLPTVIALLFLVDDLPTYNYNQYIPVNNVQILLLVRSGRPPTHGPQSGRSCAQEPSSQCTGQAYRGLGIILHSCGPSRSSLSGMCTCRLTSSALTVSMTPCIDSSATLATQSV